MSNDLVKRMRDTGEGDIYLAPTSTKKMIDEAADHIDALNAAFVAYATERMERIDELEAALLRMVEWAESHGLYADEEAQPDPVFANARAALEGKDAPT
jgi:hypothetical protein